MREGGRWVATPLLAALAMIATFDVLFAVDCIPAIFAVTRDTFVVFAANAFSLLGMVSLYFLLAGMIERFRYLNLGLAVHPRLRRRQDAGLRGLEGTDGPVAHSDRRVTGGRRAGLPDP